MSKRTLAKLLALNRIQYGLGMVLNPQLNAKVWVGARNSRRPPTKLLAQALGARDLVLGAGGLAAMQAGDTAAARRWFAAQAVADGVDLLATLGGRDLPTPGRVFAVTVAAGSVAIAAGYAARG